MACSPSFEQAAPGAESIQRRRAERGFEEALSALAHADMGSAERHKIQWGRLAFEWGKRSPEDALLFVARMKSLLMGPSHSPKLFRAMSGFAAMGAQWAKNGSIPIEAKAFELIGGGGEAVWSIRMASGASHWDQDRIDAICEAAESMAYSIPCVSEEKSRAGLSCEEWMKSWNGDSHLRFAKPAAAHWAMAWGVLQSVVEPARIAGALARQEHGASCEEGLRPRL